MADVSPKTGCGGPALVAVAVVRAQAEKTKTEAKVQRWVNRTIELIGF